MLRKPSGLRISHYQIKPLSALQRDDILLEGKDDIDLPSEKCLVVNSQWLGIENTYPKQTKGLKMQAVEQGSQCVLPRPTETAPRDLLEMQITGPSSKPTESQTQSRIQQSVF